LTPFVPPFFDPPTNTLSEADLAELVSPNGSSFVDKLIRSDNDLNKYYTKNDAAHDKVKIKDWLLAEAFPATTLPMGANENGVMSKGKNIDMSGVKTSDGGCCKTSEGSWPRDSLYQGQRVWRHSDFKDIPYQHVYGFYNQIKRLVEQP